MVIPDDLQRRIAGLEGDAQNRDDLADQLEHTGKGKNDAITKLFSNFYCTILLQFRYNWSFGSSKPKPIFVA